MYKSITILFCQLFFYNFLIAQHWKTYNVNNSTIQTDDVKFVNVDRDNNIWAGTASGVSYLSKNTWNTFHNYQFSHGVNGIWDFQDTIWIGTELYDLWSYDKKGSFKDYRGNVSGPSVHQFVKDFDDTLWTVDGSRQLRKWNGSEWLKIENIVSTNKKMILDNIGNIYIAGGYFKIRYTDGEFFTYNDKYDGSSENFIPSTSTTSVDVDGNGNYWVGTSDFGLLEHDGKKWKWYNQNNSEITSNHVTTVVVDNNNVKWIGTIDGGISRYDGTSWVTYNTNNSSLPSDRINSMVIDSTGEKWIACGYTELTLPHQGTGVTSFADLVADFTYSINANEVSFTNLSKTLNGEIVKWKWNIEGQPAFSSEENPTFVFPEPFFAANVTLYVEDERLGYGKITKSVSLLNTVSENLPFVGIKVYALPDKREININFGSSKNADITIYNGIGQQVYNKKSINELSHQLWLDNSGVYILDLEISGKNKRYKLIS